MTTSKGPMQNRPPSHSESIETEVKRLRKWVNDLQSGMFINCVYCGHRYGPNRSTPVAMADVLKRHIAQCPEHPLSKALAELEWHRTECVRHIHERDEALAELERLRAIPRRTNALLP